MTSPEALVQRLLDQTKKTADVLDYEGLRTSYEQVLGALEVSPAESHIWRDGTDVIGATYERLLSGALRRDAGQFFTPFWAGEVMAGWLFEEEIDLLLDPGCGSGGLLVPAARHPRRGSARLLGIDLDPLAIKMADANRRVRAIEQLDLRVANFLLEPFDERPGGVICNPPYSRHHVIPAADKMAIHNGFTQRLGIAISRLAALHVLFLLRALEVSSDDARIAFITPSSWLDVNYGRRVKRWLLEHAHVEAMILIDAEHLFFDGALTTAAITLIRKGAPSDRATKILRLSGGLPEPAEVLALLRNEPSETKLLVESVCLSANEKWAGAKPKPRAGVPLKDVARIRRGIATGANGFFVISEQTRRKRGIPVEQLKPCVTSPRAITLSELTEEAFAALPEDVPRWLVDSPEPAAGQAKTPLGVYLRYGRRKRVHKGYLAANRKLWYSLEQRGKSPILFSYFNRSRPRFVRNVIGAVPLNNWLIVEPNDGIDLGELYEALTSENAMRQLRERSRVYGAGLWKLEPSELGEIRLPNTLKK